MSHIFVSYSRKDSNLVERIVDALTGDDLKPWIDWKSIPKGEVVQREIHQAIEEADVFLFFVSPDSIQSKWCGDEIDHAARNNKRILPIVLHDTDPKIIHPEISKRNWIFCREGQDNFFKAIEETQKTIHTDYEWLKYHTELQVKALKWRQKKGDPSRLLWGKELREAKSQIAEKKKKDPPLTELQQLYILKSQLFMKRLIYGIGGVAIVTLMVIAGLAMWPSLSMERAIPGNWVLIPGGNFVMGMNREEAETANSLCVNSPPETAAFCSSVDELINWSGRQAKADLPEFQIMDNEVTNAQYMQCIDAGGCKRPDGWSYESVDINKPAANLNWQSAMIYCTWLKGRLPTESEWEKAARGPDQTYFPWGNEWNLLEPRANLENVHDNSPGSIDAFAESDVNNYGVFNMTGNVMEWTISPMSFHAEGETFSDEKLKPSDIDQINWVIVRGGSWGNPASNGMASHRGSVSPTKQDPALGFRCVCPNSQVCDSPWDGRWVWSHDYYPEQ
jgi:formylglycine-generating enzyme required for sulfatase activity